MMILEHPKFDPLVGRPFGRSGQRMNYIPMIRRPMLAGLGMTMDEAKAILASSHLYSAAEVEAASKLYYGGTASGSYAAQTGTATPAPTAASTPTTVKTTTSGTTTPTSTSGGIPASDITKIWAMAQSTSGNPINAAMMKESVKYDPLRALYWAEIDRAFAAVASGAVASTAPAPGSTTTVTRPQQVTQQTVQPGVSPAVTAPTTFDKIQAGATDMAASVGSKFGLDSNIVLLIAAGAAAWLLLKGR